MNNKSLISLFLVLSTIYLFSLTHAPYSGQFLLKVAPILLLVAMAYNQLAGKTRTLMVGALIASGFGDVFLALTFANSFIFGLGAFLIAQIIYSVTFIQHRLSSPISIGRKIIALVIALYSVYMASYILPATGDLFIPVTIYLTVITVMALSALLGNLHLSAVIGAISFVASDSALSLSLFKTPLPYSDWVVMFTYYAAQLAILLGMIRQQDTICALEKSGLSQNAG
ncbi:lysoplasmalogenase [Thalassotalea fusca]